MNRPVDAADSGTMRGRGSISCMCSVFASSIEVPAARQSTWRREVRRSRDASRTRSCSLVSCCRASVRAAACRPTVSCSAAKEPASTEPDSCASSSLCVCMKVRVFQATPREMCHSHAMCGGGVYDCPTEQLPGTPGPPQPAEQRAAQQRQQHAPRAAALQDIAADALMLL